MMIMWGKEHEQCTKISLYCALFCSPPPPFSYASSSSAVLCVIIQMYNGYIWRGI